MTPQELKNSILQWAIQGKLVEQRPEEGTAEELYWQIQAEKQRLIKEGKIKKEKPLPEIAEEEKPFKIPESWKWVRLGEICKIINGFTPKKTNQDFWDNGTIPWFTIEDIRRQGRFITTTQQRITNKALPKNSEKLIPSDAVLLCCTASIGEYAYTKIALTTNQQFNALVIGASYEFFLYPMYLYEYVQTLKNTIISKAGRTTFNFLSVGKLSNFLLPVPPLAEQKRIVAKIEELLPYIDRYEQAWNRLEKLNKRFPIDMQKSLLQWAIQGKLVEQRAEEGTAEELYQQIQAEKQRLLKEGKIKKEKPLPEIEEEEKPFEIPESWKWVRLGEILNKLVDGTHNTPKYTASGIPFISVRNISSGSLDINDTKYISIEEHQLLSERCNPERGDILLSKVGTTGVPAKIETDIEFSLFVSVALLKFNKNLLDIDFLVYVILTPNVQKQCKEHTRGVGNKNWVIKDIANTIFPLPPLAEQKRIVAKLEELLPLCQRLQKRMTD